MSWHGAHVFTTELCSCLAPGWRREELRTLNYLISLMVTVSARKSGPLGLRQVGPSALRGGRWGGAADAILTPRI